MKRRCQGTLGRAATSIIVVVLLNPTTPFAKAKPVTRLYATKSCIEGENGPGVAYYLSTEKGCSKPIPSYPYVEIDIREWPVAMGKATPIGRENWAFHCPSSHDGCVQAISGKVVFEHSTDPTGERSIRSTGRYELTLQGGQIENGRFEIVCGLPCG